MRGKGQWRTGTAARTARGGGCRRRPPRDERGAGSALVLVLMVLVLVALAGVVAVVSVMGTVHQARGAADLSALAGASALVEGGPPCPQAERIAAANGARVLACEVAGERVAVDVAAPLRLRLAGLVEEATAHAEAEPVP